MSQNNFETSPAPRLQPLEIQYMSRPIDPDEAARIIARKHRPVDMPPPPREITVTGNNVPTYSRAALNRPLPKQPADPAPPDTNIEMNSDELFRMELAALREKYGKPPLPSWNGTDRSDAWADDEKVRG